MINAFKILNDDNNILGDEFGNDVSIQENGNAKFKSVISETITGLLTTAAQPNITSLGTLTALTLSGAVSGITTLAATTVNSTNLAGTLTTAAQTNITSLGTLTALNVDNINIDLNTISSTNTNGNLIFSPNGTGVIQLTKTLDANSQNITNVNTIGPCFGVSMNGSITSIGNTSITITPGGTGTILAGKALNMQTNNITNVGTLTATNLAGTLTTAAQTNITSVGTLTVLAVDNISIDGSTISATNTNGNVNINANGTGKVVVNTLSTTVLDVDNININGSTISATNTNGNVNINANGTGKVIVNTLSTSGMIEVDNLNLSGNSISSANTNGNVILAPNGTGVVQVGGGVISSTDQLVLQSSNVLGVKINNFRVPFTFISTASGVTYFTQNTNLTGLTNISSSSYTLYSLTSGTTFSVTEDCYLLMIMSATFIDQTNERLVSVQMYENGSWTTEMNSALPYLDAGNSYSNLSYSNVLFFRTGRSYTWRFVSAAGGTADLVDLKIYLTKV